MHRILFLLLFLAVNSLKAQTAQVIHFKDFEQITNFSKTNDTTYVINFWATWCKPCVAELPNFEKVSKAYKGRKVKVLFVSMDFVKKKNILDSFIKARHIDSKVYLLNEPDYNSWIEKVDKDWSGALPGTLVINPAKGVRKFYEQEFTYDELNNIVKPITQ